MADGAVEKNRVILRYQERDEGSMKFLLIVLGVIALGFVGVAVYALQINAPETEIEVVIPDDTFPR